jgi:TetR/AcrR family transcriptional regulator, transcriptional repressor for nem operon
MGRQKSFTPLETLNQLTAVFLLNGYENTSLSQLEAASGLGKQSLYNAFGDKKDMYLGAVECAAARTGNVRALMQTAPNGRVALQRFFDILCTDCLSDDPTRRSCIVSAGLLEGSQDEDIRDKLLAKWQGTHALLRETIQRGQTDRSVRNGATPDALADHLMMVMGGLRVMARTNPPPSRMKRAAASGLSLLDAKG